MEEGRGGENIPEDNQDELVSFKKQKKGYIIKKFFCIYTFYVIYAYDVVHLQMLAGGQCMRRPHEWSAAWGPLPRPYLHLERDKITHRSNSSSYLLHCEG